MIKQIDHNVLQAAFKDTIPIMIGYLFLGLGFGILMQHGGLNLWFAVMMSVITYSGAMQYVAVGLFASGADLVTVALTTLLVNARHLFYAISMVDKFKGVGKKKWYMAFALTDETFTLVSRDNTRFGEKRASYCLWVSLFDQSYWIVGTALGCIAGSTLPINFAGVDFALTALFVTFFVEQWLTTKNHAPAMLGVVSTAFCLLIFGKNYFLIPSMVIITSVLIGMSLKGKEQDRDL